MRLIETYSHYCGVTPKSAFIDEAYFPIPFEKYVVVHNSTGMATKTYDMFDEVTSNINLPIVQLGGKDDILLPNVYDFRGKTTWNHTAYIIHKCSLFIGGDSVCAHIAAHFKIPSIVLWGATLPTTCATNWNPDKTININPVDRYGCETACHASQCVRHKKCINSITPEYILDKVRGFLGEDSTSDVKILHIGPSSKVSLVEWVPMSMDDGVRELFSKITGPISIRADYYTPNFQELSNFCNSTNNKYVILANSADFKNFSVHPSKIEQLLILVDLNTISEGISLLKDLTKKMYKTRLISKLDHHYFDKYKIEFLDYPQMAKLVEYQPTQAEKDKFSNKLYNIKSERRIVGKNGNVYYTFFDALNIKNNVEISKNNANYILEDEHLKELQFITIRQYAQN